MSPGVRRAVAAPLRKRCRFVMTVVAWIERDTRLAIVTAAALARFITVAAASWGGPLRKIGGKCQVATVGSHVLAIGYAVFIACSTLLPSGTDLWFFVFRVGKLAPPRVVGNLVLVSAFLGGLVLAGVAWRRRYLWMSRLSLPLAAYAIVCGGALGMLVLIGQPPWYLRRLGLGELWQVVAEFDVRHAIFYFGFTVVAAIAWRRRVSLPVLGLLLFAFGFCLELAQELVPTRYFRTKDLASNGLGITLGLCWVYLYDSLVGVRGTGLSRMARYRRRRTLARRDGVHAAVQPRRS
jgi:hypothetical protein